MSNLLDKLIADRDRIQEEVNEAKARLHAAEGAVMMERFRDVERYKKGDVVLVPRKLFGEKRWWPARIEEVMLNFNEGWYAETYEPDPGGYWQTLGVTYRVILQEKDGSYGRKHDSFRHSQVEPAPADD